MIVDDVQIFNREIKPGCPFADVLITFYDSQHEMGVKPPRYAYSRLWHPLPDTEYEKSQQAKAFLARQRRTVP